MSLHKFRTYDARMIGLAHRNMESNCQDAVRIEVNSDCIVLTVSDGCGSSPYSELGALVTVNAMLSITNKHSSARQLADNALEYLLEMLRDIAEGLKVANRLKDFVYDHLLATTLTAVVYEDKTYIFGMGDGAFSIDGEMTIIKSGKPGANAPDFPAYNLIPGHVPFEMKVHFEGNTADINTLSIYTDGIGDVINSGPRIIQESPDEQGLEVSPRAFETDLRYVFAPHMIDKMLASARDDFKQYRDDIALAAIIRK